MLKSIYYIKKKLTCQLLFKGFLNAMLLCEISGRQYTVASQSDNYLRLVFFLMFFKHNFNTLGVNWKVNDTILSLNR